MLVRLRIGHEPYVNDVPDADEGPPNPLDETPGELLSDDSHPAARRPVVVELDLRTLVGIAVTMLVAFAIVALFQGAPATITRLAIALLFALALDPLVVAAQRRFRLGRRPAVGLVGTVFALGVLIMVLVVGPAAVREARKFGDQLPQTVEQLYDIPIVGHRLRDADAAGQVTKWLEDLPARVNTGDIVSVAETLVGGAAATLTVVVFVLALLLDGEVLVRRLRNLVPDSRRGSLDRLGTLFYSTVGNYFAGSIFVAVLDGAVVLILGLLLGCAAGAGRRHLGDGDQPHPADRRLPRRLVLRAARPLGEPDDRLAGPGPVRRLPADREQHHPAGHRRAVDEPVAADDDDRRPDRRRGGRRARRAGRHAARRHGQGDLQGRPGRRGAGGHDGAADAVPPPPAVPAQAGRHRAARSGRAERAVAR